MGGGLTGPLRTLEELHGSLVLLRRFTRTESSQVAALTGLGVLLARVQAIVAALQFSYHRES
jgi:hypothetical protein